MSLNCLSCTQLLQRTNSFTELFADKEYKEYKEYKKYKEAYKKVDRSWSGSLSAVSSSSSKCSIPKRATAVAKIKAEHRRSHSTGNIDGEPKLVRCSGMRRDWSFENLTENQDQRLSCH